MFYIIFKYIKNNKKGDLFMGQIKDLTNQKFGKLLVLEKTDERRNRQVVWKCLCDCGKETFVVGQALRNGHTTSCGCRHHESFNVKDITGKNFGKLTVLKRLGSNEKREAIWDCICKCGNHRICTTHQLNQIEVRSCQNCVDYRSKGEEVIAKLLQDNNINYIKEYIFKELKTSNGGYLRYDFAILNNFGDVIALIEYDGSQHFKPEEKFGGLEEFKKRQERDNIKNNFAIKMQIPLIRINKDYRYLKVKDLMLDGIEGIFGKYKN